MKGRNSCKRLVKIIFSSFILMIAVGIYLAIWYNFISPTENVWYARKGNWMMGALYGILLMFFLNMYGGFRLGYLEKGNVIYSQILSLFIVNVLTYLQIALLSYGFPVILPFILLMFCDIVAVFVWTNFYDVVYRSLFLPSKLIVIFGREPSANMIEKIRKRKTQYNLDEIVSIAEDRTKVIKMVEQHDSVILWDIETRDRNELLKFCFENSIRVYLTPKISDIIVKSAEEMHTFDTPLLLTRNNGLTIEQKCLKRLLDIIISLFMILLTSPIMLLTAAMVKAYDGGPIIYKQKRLTIDAKEFNVYKFRSMDVEAEKDGVARLASIRDSRITPVGKIIRMLRVDELPQLLNILEGSMSLVGPRPERPEIAEKYQEYLPQFKMRLKVKAGLTGYAQVFGKYNTTPYDKLKLDITYIQNYSILLDLKIMVLTLKILLMKESTEGINSEDNEM